MRFINTAIVTVISLVLGYPACAVDPCIKHSEECPVSVSSSEILSVSPRRINITGDKITVTMRVQGQILDSVKLTQNGAADLSLGKLAIDGTVNISGDMLRAKGFKPGKASLLIGANPAETIRLYLSPSFRTTPELISTGLEDPLWSGVGPNHTLTALQKDATQSQPQPVHFVDFNYATRLAIATRPYTYPATVQAAATTSSIFTAANMTGEVVYLQRCLGTSTDCDSIRTSYKSVLGVAVDRNSTLLGGILDNKLNIYPIVNGFNAATKIIAISSIKNPKAIGIGDLDDDSNADLISWDGAAINIFRQTVQTGTQNFNLDSALSGQLKLALGSDQPNILLVTDLDGDNLDDVIYSTTNQVVWIINQGFLDGEIKFTRGGMLSVAGVSIMSMTVSDIDTDTKSDIIITSKSEKSIKFYINQATY
jgi:hypothetical protein